MKIALTVHSTTEPTQEVIDFLTSKGDVKYVIRNEAEGNFKEFIIDKDGNRFDLKVSDGKEQLPEYEIKFNNQQLLSTNCPIGLKEVYFVNNCFIGVTQNKVYRGTNDAIEWEEITLPSTHLSTSRLLIAGQKIYVVCLDKLYIADSSDFIFQEVTLDFTYNSFDSQLCTIVYNNNTNEVLLLGYGDYSFISSDFENFTKIDKLENPDNKTPYGIKVVSHSWYDPSKNRYYIVASAFTAAQETPFICWSSDGVTWELSDEENDGMGRYHLNSIESYNYSQVRWSNEKLCYFLDFDESNRREFLGESCFIISDIGTILLGKDYSGSLLISMDGEFKKWQAFLKTNIPEIYLPNFNLSRTQFQYNGGDTFYNPLFMNSSGELFINQNENGMIYKVNYFDREFPPYNKNTPEKFTINGNPPKKQSTDYNAYDFIVKTNYDSYVDRTTKEINKSPIITKSVHLDISQNTFENGYVDIDLTSLNINTLFSIRTIVVEDLVISGLSGSYNLEIRNLMQEPNLGLQHTFLGDSISNNNYIKKGALLIDKTILRIYWMYKDNVNNSVIYPSGGKLQAILEYTKITD